MSTSVISDEDKKRIQNSDYYLQTKRTMKSHEEYKYVNVGEVYSISYVSNGKISFISRGKAKDRFMVIHKDDGFIFAKRIKSDGALSKDVVCLTIRFPQPDYTIELDAEQAEAIIFQTEDKYDPFKEGKDLSKKKNKARRLNSAKLTTFDLLSDAVNFVRNLNVGDALYDSGTAFGEGIVEWKVVSIETRAVDRTPCTDWNNRVYAYGSTESDKVHNRFGLTELIEIQVETKELPKSRRWLNKQRSMTFVDFFVCPERRRSYYATMPVSIEDLP
jgi:hypothetical protein